jgi:hypothetical protein
MEDKKMVKEIVEKYIMSEKKSLGKRKKFSKAYTGKMNLAMSTTGVWDGMGKELPLNFNSQAKLFSSGCKPHGLGGLESRRYRVAPRTLL